MTAEDLMYVEHDAEKGIFDKLYVPRLEALFYPNADGSPSASGRLLLYTEWWYFRNSQVFSRSPGVRVEHSFDGLLEEEWETKNGTKINTLELLELMEVVCRKLVNDKMRAEAELLTQAQELGTMTDG